MSLLILNYCPFSWTLSCFVKNRRTNFLFSCLIKLRFYAIGAGALSWISKSHEMLFLQSVVQFWYNNQFCIVIQTVLVYIIFIFAYCAIRKFGNVLFRIFELFFNYPFWFWMFLLEGLVGGTFSETEMPLLLNWEGNRFMMQGKIWKEEVMVSWNK